MKRPLIARLGLLLVAFLVAALPVLAQTTISGHLKDAAGVGIPGSATTFVQLDLLYCGQNEAKVNGAAVLPGTASYRYSPNSVGVINIPALYGNDVISCGATTGGTRWSKTTYIKNVAGVPCRLYIAGTSFNLDTATCENANPAPPSPALGWQNISQAITQPWSFPSIISPSINGTTLKSDANHNLSLGTNSETALTTGYQNVAIGDYALLSNTTGPYNAAFGMEAMHFNTTGDNNTGLGTLALYANTTGYQNTALGSQALQWSIDSYFNNATGVESLWQLQHGNLNVSDGVSSLTHMTSGNYNTALGGNSMAWIFGGDSNTAVGLNAGYGGADCIVSYSYSAPNLTLTMGTTTGYPVWCTNTPLQFGVGDSIGLNVQSGNLVALNGWQGTVVSSTPTTVTIATSLVTGSGAATRSASTEPPQIGWVTSRNTSVGANALQNITSGQDNLAAGWDALTALSSGSFNSAVGTHSSYQVTTGQQNTAVGAYSLNGLVTGGYNTAVGFRAGSPDDVTNYEIGTYNTYLGFSAGPMGHAGFYNAICIGKSCSISAGNRAVIGDNEITDVYFGSETPTATVHAAGYKVGSTSLAASHLSNGTTGTAGTAVVLATSPTITSPTLVTPTLGAATATSVTIGAATVPTVTTPTVGQAACIKAAGPPVVIGYCSTVVSAGGACTCN